MNTAVITIKIDAKLKRQAQEIAEDLGFSLSAVVKGYLKQLIRTKTLAYSAATEEPSEYLIQNLKRSEEDIKAGRVSPRFTNARDAIAWLNKSGRHYDRTVRQNLHKTVRSR